MGRTRKQPHSRRVHERHSGLAQLIHTARAGRWWHTESAALFKEHGVKVDTLELKSAAVEMLNGFSQVDVRAKAGGWTKRCGLCTFRDYLQSFNLDDVKYRSKHQNSVNKPFILTDRKLRASGLCRFRWEHERATDVGKHHRATPVCSADLDENNELVASNYAKLVKDADLEIIAWTLSVQAHQRKAAVGTIHMWKMASTMMATWWKCSMCWHKM